MKKVLVIIFLWTISLTAYSQKNCSSYPAGYIPKDLAEALNYLNCNWQAKEKRAFKRLDENNLSAYHFGAGLGMRNNWGLWEGENELVKYFHNLGITHPDDMSGIILLSFHRTLNKKAIGLEEQVAFYKAYWENARLQEALFKVRTDSLYRSFEKGDTVKVYFHLDPDSAKPRIYLVWAFKSIEELHAEKNPVCAIKGIVAEKPAEKYSSPTLNIRITDLCGYPEVQFGDNRTLKTGSILEFEVYPDRLIEKVK